MTVVRCLYYYLFMLIHSFVGHVMGSNHIYIYTAADMRVCGPVYAVCVYCCPMLTCYYLVNGLFDYVSQLVCIGE